MGMNAVYNGAEDCPPVIPVFPLAGALLLPRGQMREALLQADDGLPELHMQWLGLGLLIRDRL